MRKNLRQERINAIERGEGPEGFSSDKACLKYWADRASANSYHGKDDTKPGTGRGRTDKNFGGDSSFAKGVRRGA